MIAAGVLAAALSTAPANPHAAVLHDFDQRVAVYAKLHHAAESQLPKLKPTASPEAITRHVRELGDRIRQLRTAARQGDIFTPAIAAEFHRLIGVTMGGAEAGRIRDSLKSAEPVKLALEVNDPYPPGVPLQSTPPTLLLNLPELPREVRYQVVSGALVLHDIGANLVVDFLPDAIPVVR
jgi:hypothetical protein